MTSLKGKKICVFCGSSEDVDPKHIEAARELGRLIGGGGASMVYGGAMVGLMGEVARGVHDEKGHVIGVIPGFLNKEGVVYEQSDQLIVSEDMRNRKTIMEENSDAFITLPGGLGTLEEFMEIITLKQLQRVEKPHVLVNTDHFYDPLLAQLEIFLKEGYVKEKYRQLFAVVTSPLEAIRVLEQVFKS